MPNYLDYMWNNTSMAIRLVMMKSSGSPMRDPEPSSEDTVTPTCSEDIAEPIDAGEVRGQN